MRQDDRQTFRRRCNLMVLPDITLDLETHHERRQEKRQKESRLDQSHGARIGQEKRRPPSHVQALVCASGALRRPLLAMK